MDEVFEHKKYKGPNEGAVLGATYLWDWRRNWTTCEPSHFGQKAMEFQLGQRWWGPFDASGEWVWGQHQSGKSRKTTLEYPLAHHPLLIYRTKARSLSCFWSFKSRLWALPTVAFFNPAKTQAIKSYRRVRSGLSPFSAKSYTTCCN